MVAADRGQVVVDAVEARPPGQRFREGDVNDFVTRIGDDATRIGVDALEKMVVSFGLCDQHGTSFEPFGKIWHRLELAR